MAISIKKFDLSDLKDTPNGNFSITRDKVTPYPDEIYVKGILGIFVKVRPGVYRNKTLGYFITVEK